LTGSVAVSTLCRMDTELVLPGTLAEAHAVIRELWTALRALGAEHERVLVEQRQMLVEQAALRERVAELERRLGQNSSNSSRPPSSDPPWTPPSPAKRQPSGRKAGGQPGRQASQRELLPPDQVDRLVAVWPERCQHCGETLPECPDLVAALPERHQVSELPPVQVTVTEYQLQRLRCPGCGEETRAALPEGVPTGAFGPRLQAAVALVSGRYRLSRRSVVGVLADLVGARIALGSVDALCQETSTALAQPVSDLAQAVRAVRVANADETRWLQAGKTCWLWVVVTQLVTVFTIAQSRGADVIKGLLGEDFAGIVTSDRYTAYLWLGTLHRQLCWAHLKRDFQGLVDRGGAAKEVGAPALALVARLFAAWHAARHDLTAWEQLPQTMQPIQDEFRTLLEAGQSSTSTKAAGLCRYLLALWPALWPFVTVPGLEPTNNAAERAIRPAVLWRKQSLGTKTDAGSQFVARMLSVAATCQQQQRPLLDYLTAVCFAQRAGQPIPSLLPCPP
jgi:transposase